MAREITKQEFETAASTVRKYIYQQIVVEAKRQWDEYEEIREEYDSFDHFVKEFFSDSLEDECPGGINLEVLIYGLMRDEILGD